jgi:hypothetical protein
VLQQTIDRSNRKKGKNDDEDDVETDKGYRLAPSKADRAPWYTKAKDESQPKMDQAKKYAILSYLSNVILIDRL